MPIRTVRAVSLATMREFLRGAPNVAAHEAAAHDSTYIVSITDPATFPLIRRPTVNQLQLQFHDVDDHGREEGYVFFDEAMASDVCALVRRAQEDPADVYFLVNCHAGVSRSGAVSWFVRQVAGIDFDDWRRLNPQVIPNRLVKSLLSRAWNEGC